MPTVTADGTKVSYSDTGGDGTPVVLLHAFPLNSKMWEPQIEALSDRFRFIVPDLQGFGGSDAPDDRTIVERAVTLEPQVKRALILPFARWKEERDRWWVTSSGGTRRTCRNPRSAGQPWNRSPRTRATAVSERPRTQAARS